MRIPRESIEKLETAVTAPSDPTGNPVAFAFAVAGTRPTVWTAGTWSGTYANGRATAVTPTIGVTGSDATVELAVGTHLAFVRVSVNPEVPVRQCGSVTIE